MPRHQETGSYLETESRTDKYETQGDECEVQETYCQKDEGYSAEEIYSDFAPAVVDIEAQLILTSVDAPGPICNPSEELRTFTVKGNGAFVDCHYILTASSLVLAPPTTLAYNNRYPYVGQSDRADGTMPSELVQMSRILVTVRYLNGKKTPGKQCKKYCGKCEMCKTAADGHTFVYEAKLVFVDGAGGYALLKIDPIAEWNRCLPKIKECHPKFSFGKSRALKCGDPIFLMGSYNTSVLNQTLGQNSFGITQGVVSNNRGADANGWLLPELIVVDTPAYNVSQGMPMINKSGDLVGLQLSDVVGAVGRPGDNRLGQGEGGVSGVSEFFFRPGLKTFYAVQKNKRNKKYSCHLVQVVDAGCGAYYKYVKGYAGIAYAQLRSTDFNTYIRNWTTGTRNALLNKCGTLYNGPIYKDISGVRAVTLAGDSEELYAMVPGAGAGAPFGNYFKNSAFKDSIPPESIITAAGDCYLGQQSGQIVPALLTWRLLPGDSITFTILKADICDGYAGADNYAKSYKVEDQLQDFPATMDYPWGLINNFPLLSDPLNEASGPSPVDNPQIPVLNFHPAF